MFNTANKEDFGDNIMDAGPGWWRRPLILRDPREMKDPRLICRETQGNLDVDKDNGDIALAIDPVANFSDDDDNRTEIVEDIITDNDDNRSDVVVVNITEEKKETFVQGVMEQNNKSEEGVKNNIVEGIVGAEVMDNIVEEGVVVIKDNIVEDVSVKDSFFACEKCLKVFYKKQALIGHKKCHNVKILRCGKCEQVFSYKRSLLYHQLTHIPTTASRHATRKTSGIPDVKSQETEPETVNISDVVHDDQKKEPERTEIDASSEFDDFEELQIKAWEDQIMRKMY